MLSMLPLCLTVMPVSCSFFKSLFSPRSPQPLFGNALRSFLLHNLIKKIGRQITKFEPIKHANFFL